MAHLIIPAVLVVTVAMIASGIMRAIDEHGALALAWRWFTGNPWHGKPHTDAGWFTRGERALTHNGRALPWHYWPRMKRAAIRTSGTVLTPVMIYAWWKLRTYMIAALAATMIAAIVYAWQSARRAIRDKKVREVCKDLSVPLARMLDIAEVTARQSILIRPDYMTVRQGEIGRITLPAKYAASQAQRKDVMHLVSSRLPVDCDYHWDTRRRPQILRLIAAPECPSMVPFTDMLDAMKSCELGQVVIGLDRHGNVFHGSFTGDDPHWGFSVGSGRGKSSFLINTAAQLLHNEPGATIAGIDPKMASLNALAGVPGVTIANDPRDMGTWDGEAQTHHGGMWGLIDEFEREMMRRLDVLNDDPTATFPIAVLMLDELNQFSSMTKRQWREIKTKNDPSGPPIWDKIAAIHWMGRAVRCHCVSVGQRLDDKATGGIGLRDSMGFRGLAGYRKQQWDMLIGGPMPRSQKPKGRWIYSDGQTETWVQNMLGHVDPNVNAQIIRDYAMAGRHGTVKVDSGKAISTLDVREMVIGLDAAAAFLGISNAAFRKRRERAGGTIPGEMRRGNQPAWTRDDLAKWAGIDARV